MKAAPKKIIAWQADEALVEAIDQVAKRQRRSRSDVVRQAVLHELAKEGLCPVAA